MLLWADWLSGVVFPDSSRMVSTLYLHVTRNVVSMYFDPCFACYICLLHIVSKCQKEIVLRWVQGTLMMVTVSERKRKGPKSNQQFFRSDRQTENQEIFTGLIEPTFELLLGYKTEAKQTRLLSWVITSWVKLLNVLTQCDLSAIFVATYRWSLHKRNTVLGQYWPASHPSHLRHSG